MKIRLVGVALFHVDGRTDEHEEGNSHFSQFLRTRVKTIVKQLDEAKSVGLFSCSFNHIHLETYLQMLCISV